MAIISLIPVLFLPGISAPIVPGRLFLHHTGKAGLTVPAINRLETRRITRDTV